MAPGAERTNQLAGHVLKGLLKAILPVAVLAGAVVVAGDLWSSKPKVEPEPPQERVWPVAAETVRMTRVRPRIHAFGEITTARTVDLRPLVAGRVVAVGAHFIDGGVVAEGETLIEIDDFEYQAEVDEALADLEQARAKLAEIDAVLDAQRSMLKRDRERVEMSRRDVARREELREKGVTSEKALDDARMALNTDQQRVIATNLEIEKFAAQARQQLAAIQRLEVRLRRARRNLDETRLTAPFDGFLVDVDAQIGKRIGTGDRVAKIYDATRMEARFHLSHPKFSRLRRGGDYIGRRVRVVWRVDREELAYEGRIDRIDGRIDAASGGVDLFARLHGNGVQTPLRPGAFVEVEIDDATYEDVIRLPETAVHDGDTVYLVENGRLVPRKVEIAVRDGAAVYVRSDDIPEGGQVVSTRFTEIGPGVKVEVR